MLSKELTQVEKLLRATLFVVVVFGSSLAFPQNHPKVGARDRIIESLVREDPTIELCISKSGGPDPTLKVESIELSQNQSKDIMVRGLSPCVCGPRKCLNRIYRQAGDGVELLLNADFAQEIEPQDHYTNGYRNLKAAVYVFHSFTSVLYVYQYDGRQYKWDHCEMRFYFYSETVNGVPFKGRVRYHPEPQISWVGCNPQDPYGP